MRLKLDENVPRRLVEYLTQRGHDTDTVLDEQLGGQNDPTIVAAAAADDRCIFTLDRGLGDLRRYPPGTHSGIIILPAGQPSQETSAITDLVDRLLRDHDLGDLHGCVVVVEPDRIRVRRPELEP